MLILYWHVQLFWEITIFTNLQITYSEIFVRHLWIPSVNLILVRHCSLIVHFQNDTSLSHGPSRITVKPAHGVISIKQSPVFKGHIFLSCHRKFHMNWNTFKFENVSVYIYQDLGLIYMYNICLIQHYKSIHFCLACLKLSEF